MPNKPRKKRNVRLRGEEKEGMHGSVGNLEIYEGNEIVQESPLLREVVISSCFLGERKLLPHLFQPDSEQSLSNEH